MIKNSGFPFPNKRITQNLAPADIRKKGQAYAARGDRHGATRLPSTGTAVALRAEMEGGVGRGSAQACGTATRLAIQSRPRLAIRHVPWPERP